ncbi:protein YniD [Enterobacter asburiae]|uniref:Protein YniD n=1 Tax=Enterobacter asburiae TaxID=61645 RepID=A0A376F8Q8_ENTAS|nr:protein YniD [Enterobacter asburiae]
MPTKRFAVKHWKMVLVLIAICGAMLLLRWGGNDLGLVAKAGHQKGRQKTADNKRADIIIGPLLLHSITQ